MTDRPHIEDVDLGDHDRGLSAALRQLPTWSRVLLIVALLMMLGGIAAWAFGAITDGTAPAEPDFTTSVLEPNALLPDDTTGATAETDDSELWTTYGPAVFRLGFSFVAAFAVACVLRAFFKITILVVGLLVLALLGLQTAGVLDVDWDAMSDRFGSATEWLGEQFSSVRTLLAGYLPSAASATAGLVAGFRRS